MKKILVENLVAPAQELFGVEMARDETGGAKLQLVGACKTNSPPVLYPEAVSTKLYSS